MLASALFQVLLTATLAAAHVIITYPGCRGNNFVTNGTFPYGMQWMYPCGGLSLSRNRTFWSVKGGPLAFQPGWFSGHSKALLYVNIGFDTDAPDGGPMNWTTQLVPAFQLLGPSNGPYPGTICLKHVAVPESLGVKAGQNATLQVVEIAAHGASLFGCSDITFVDEGDEKIPPLNDSTCFNTQELGFADVYTITTQKPIFKDGSQPEESGAETISFWYMKRHMTHSSWRFIGWLPAVLGGLWVFL